jgi:hypothetical protein
MLPPYIIEQIRKREEKESREDAVIQLPLPERRHPIEPKPPLGDESQRGVVIIDLV